MNNSHFFCSEVSRQVDEDLLGSAKPYQTTVLIEFPFPWSSSALESKGIPDNLRDLAKSLKKSQASVRFQLVSQASCPSARVEPERSRILIYQRSPGIFCSGYQRWEGTVERHEEIAPLVAAHLNGDSPFAETSRQPLRDLLVCVHGSRDKCCAKYGFPFYRQARDTVARFGDEGVRLWQTSHIGGHRFAPTLIDFPSGRYYGRLNQEILTSILTQSGDLQAVTAAYRGWSVLPMELQVAERQLIERYGWDWFNNCQVAQQRLAHKMNPAWIAAELTVKRSRGAIDSYAIEIVKDDCKTVCLRPSCGAAEEEEQVKYRVESFIDLAVARKTPAAL